ncbi:hypothetical protein ACFL5L_01710 [candidate division KSB1 bacterium]
MKRSIFLVGASILLFSIWGCDLNEPAMPQWEVSLTEIPFIGPDTLTMGESINDEPDDNLFVNAEGVYSIQFTGNQSIEVQDQMKQESVTPAPFAGTIGPFSVEDVTQSVDFPIGDVFPAVTTGNPVPAAQVTTFKLVTMGNYSSATFESGTITLTLDNNLPWDLGAPVTVRLIDNSNATQIDSVVFTTELASGSSDEGFFDLAGATISNDLKVELFIDEDGTGAAPVTLVGGDDFTVDVTMENMVASSAVAKIPPIDYTGSFDISTDSIQVISAEVETGQLTLEFESGFNFDVDMTLTLPQVLDGATPVTETFTVLALSSTVVPIVLDGMTMNLEDGSLDFELDVDVDNTVLRTISAGDQITTTATVTEIVFSEITAAIQIGLDFPSFEQEVIEDLGVEIPDILFSNITLTFEFDDTPADMTISLNMIGTKESSTENALYTFDIAGGQDNTVVLSNTGVTVNGVSSGTGSGITDVFNLIPQSISFTGTAQIDDDSAILDGTPVSIVYTADVPFFFGLENDAKAFDDPESLDIEDDSRDILRDNFKGSNVTVIVENGLPVGGSLEIRTATQAQYDADPTGSTWPSFVTVSFTGAPTDAQGNVITPVDEQEVVLDIPESKVLQLADAEYTYWEATMFALPLGKIKDTDTIILRKGYLSGTMLINDELFDTDDGTGGNP